MKRRPLFNFDLRGVFASMHKRGEVVFAFNNGFNHCVQDLAAWKQLRHKTWGPADDLAQLKAAREWEANKR